MNYENGARTRSRATIACRETMVRALPQKITQVRIPSIHKSDFKLISLVVVLVILVAGGGFFIYTRIKDKKKKPKKYEDQDDFDGFMEDDEELNEIGTEVVEESDEYEITDGE